MKYTLKTSYYEIKDLSFQELEDKLYTMYHVILTVECLNRLKIYSTLTVKVDESFIQVYEQL